MVKVQPKKNSKKLINQAETSAAAEVQCNGNAACIIGQRSARDTENMVESTISEDKIEAFYASIEAETNVVVPTRSRPSEETKKALQIVRVLVRKKMSLMIHPGRSLLMKDALKHLISLPPDEGVSLATKSVIQQLLTSFRQWRLDYDSATLQLESASANLSRAEKVKEGLDANVKDFREAVMAEKVVCTKLASLEEKKRELEEQINAIKAEIADFTAEKDIIAMRKRLVFDNGRLLKAERDDLRNQVPRLKVEQERAKVTRDSIEAEWSKLGEQVIGSTCFVENRI